MRISGYRGKVVLLDFWATDCGGCVLEIPSFIELERAYKDKGFTAVGVSMDISYESLKDANEAWSRVRPFMATHGINYPIAMGDDAISRDYALNAFPATFPIDKSGRIAVAYVGVVVDKDMLQQTSSACCRSASATVTADASARLRRCVTSTVRAAVPLLVSILCLYHSQRATTSIGIGTWLGSLFG